MTSFRTQVRVSVLVLGAVLSSSVVADTYQWSRNGMTYTNGGNTADACNAGESSGMIGWANQDWILLSTSNPVAGGDEGVRTCNFKYCVGEPCTPNQNFSAVLDYVRISEAPPPPAPGTGENGCASGAPHVTTSSSAVLVGTTTCENVPSSGGSCDIHWSASAGPGEGGTFKVMGKETGASCSAPAGNAPVSDPVGPCVISASGVKVCMSPAHPPGCGTFNGTYMCAPDVPTGGCTVAADGGRLCESSTPTPPAPDSGTPGDRASPDSSATVDPDGGGTATGYHYFTPGTQSGSSTQSTANTLANTAEKPTGVDETGTPSVGDNVFSGQGDSVFGGLLESVGSEVAPAGVTWAPEVGGSAACDPAAFDSTILGINVGINLCPAIEMIRGFLKWVFFIVTGLGLMHIWRQAASGV